MQLNMPELQSTEDSDDLVSSPMTQTFYGLVIGLCHVVESQVS